MISTKNYYEKENNKVLDKYEKNLKVIKDIWLETNQYGNFGELNECYKFFNHTSEFILKLDDIEKTFNEEYFTLKSFEELKHDNNELYEELIGDNYNKSYANPQYAVKVLGEGFGQLLSSFYVRIREGISYAFKNRIFNLEENNHIFIQVFNTIKINGMDYNKLKDIIIQPFYSREALIRDTVYYNEECLSSNFRFYADTVLSTDLTDLRYLFRFDKYISENEIKMARFLTTYPINKLEKLSRAIVQAFLRGFIVDNKTRGDRNVVRLVYSVGQEIIIKHLIKELNNNGFECVFQLAMSTDPNEQCDYDHRFDNSLYLNEGYTALKEETYDIAFKLTEDCFNKLAGPIIFERFGDKPFSPQIKNECLNLEEEQENLIQAHENNLNEIYYKYEPKTETNFCMLVLPNPEIGENFENIFEDTLNINMMDNNFHEAIQQKIIDVLDKGDYVHVVGKDGNCTDIKVKLQEIKNPDKETNFINMVSESNIPLGEIYTSPRLKGTNGILHIKDAYLELEYKDLKLIFEDGYVVDYSCSNFDNENDNKKYVNENLMEFNDTLPLGEFAIGTNTEAYVMAKKYGILELLPVLIVEKVGPHFAIGDNCFYWGEDVPVYNLLNRKEVIARDNEKSILRKTNIDEAYTGIHTDITIPYEEIGSIDVVTKDGKRINIIQDGRFVLNGTEELNKPFDR